MELGLLLVDPQMFQFPVSISKITDENSISIFKLIFSFYCTELPETNNIFSELYLFPGQTAYFKCLSSPILTNENTNYRIQWFKDDSPLILDETRMILLASGALEIDEITASDKGTYQCNVTSGPLHR